MESDISSSITIHEIVVTEWSREHQQLTLATIIPPSGLILPSMLSHAAATELPNVWNNKNKLHKKFDLQWKGLDNNNNNNNNNNNKQLLETHFVSLNAQESIKNKAVNSKW